MNAIIATTTTDGSFRYELSLIGLRALAMIPTGFILLIGIIFAIQRYGQHPVSSKALLAAMGLFGFHQFGLPVALEYIEHYFWLPSFFDGSLGDFLFELPGAIVLAIFWSLILFAVFDRPPPPKFLVEDDLGRDILDK